MIDPDDSVSVVLPVRDGSDWIGEAIRSLLDQTLPPRQILVGDDGSKDGSASVVAAIGSPLVEVVRSEEPIGIPRMCNELISRARHRFVARMDADDICMPERFRLQVARLRSSDVAIVGSWARRIGASDAIHPVPAKHGAILAKMGINCPFVNPTVMFDRAKLPDGIWYDPSFRFGGDYELFARLRETARMENLERVLLLWRLHDRNVGSDPISLEEQNRTVSEVRFSVWERSGIELTGRERDALDRLVRLPLPSLEDSAHLLSSFGKALRHPPHRLWAPRRDLEHLFRDTWDYYCRVVAWGNRSVPAAWWRGCGKLGLRRRPGTFLTIAAKSRLRSRIPSTPP